jgi:hypothetical protein
MSLTMDITATEHGIVRLFAIETAQSFDHSSLTHALGIEILDPEQVDIITVSDLDELGLEGYLALGIGIEPDEIEAMRPQISALKGDVALVRSAAFGGKATTLTPRAPLRWIASFGETPLDTTAPPITTSSASGTISSPAPKQRPTNNRVLLWVLTAFAIIVLTTISMFIRITR